MGNKQSDQNEEQAFTVIRSIPILNLVYAPIRSAVYAGKGDQQRARATITETAKSVVPGVSMIVHAINKKPFVSLSDIRNQLNDGDIIEFNRGLYSHYALYLGQGKVMNIQAESKNDKESLIKGAKLEDICRDSKVRISNHDDVAMRHFGLEPQSSSEICFAAHRYNDKTVPYDFMFRNCEYYATCWRFGKGFSTQVSDILATPNGYIVEGIFAAAGGAGLSNITEATAMAKYRAFDEPMCPWLEK